MAKINKDLLNKTLQPYLDQLVKEKDGVDGALVVTVDGHLLSKSMIDGTKVKRLATMGSSLMSLGNTITGELAMGGCRNVIVENEEGYAAFMHINSKLVLVSFTRSPNGLGMLLSASRNCANLLFKQLQRL